ncbi:prepilin peptidase [Paenibacillus macquariensis]|uniref:Type IV leader peptidase family protein n=1 Tax=Paenibacillus macquariensis TaxID=948756 RepID=A0ABY1KEG4_9BACL|nr:A24 family peptidase [Paenibacillus macquariensis]OAB30509.1 hypothetical protein PMSM_22720 [Paenibacillus macquariensis subsp. macquariensis]SIR71127.1 Type IV leader peptidase family protein [Paenibacillus macquariensis]
MGQLAEIVLLFFWLTCFSIQDFRFRVVPGKWVITAIGSSIVLRIFYSPDPIWQYLVAALCTGGIFFIISMIRNGDIGGGDVQLNAWLGLTIGLMPTLWIDVVSCILAVIFSLISRRREAFPFVPFMFLATILVYVI